MIKNAKAGDVIFRLEYDEEDKTCDITQHVVVFDQRTGTSLCVNDNVEDDTTLKSPRHILLSPTQVFRTYKQAYNTYVNYLKQDLVLANKTVALTTDILSKIVKPKSKKKVQ